MDLQKQSNPPVSDSDWKTDDEIARSAQAGSQVPKKDIDSCDQIEQSADELVKLNDEKKRKRSSKSDEWSDDEVDESKTNQKSTSQNDQNKSSKLDLDDWSNDDRVETGKNRADESQNDHLTKSDEPKNAADFNDFKVPDLPAKTSGTNDAKDVDDQSNNGESNANQTKPRKNYQNYNNNFNYRGGRRGGRGGYYRNYYNHHNSFSSNASVASSNNNSNNNSGNESGKPHRKIDRRYNRSLNSNLRNQNTNSLAGDAEPVTQLDDASKLSDEEEREQIKDLNEELKQKSDRKQAIERNLHNQKTYYDQRNNLESDEMSDIQSDFESKNNSLDEKMKELVKLMIESFVPFNILHGSYFSNLLRSRFGIRKMPKLVQMRDFFLVMSELGHKYIAQTLSGAASFTLCFEFWKTANKRHQFLTIRASYIDVFVRRTPVLTCFKVFPDWTTDDYIEKFNAFFKHYQLERVKVFSVVTNFRAKQFLNAIDIYIGSEKVLWCLAHQLNNKFNEMLLACDYEEDKIHYERKFKELASIPADNDLQCGSEQEYYSDENNDGNNDDNNDENKDDFDTEENNEDKAKEHEAGNETDNEVPLNDVLNEDQDDEDELIDLDEENMAFVRLVEEPCDIFDELDLQKSDDVPYNVRIVKSLLRTYAFIADNEELLTELNDITSRKDGHEFELFHLLAYKNWNYIFQFVFYVTKTKDDLKEFVKKHEEIPFDLVDEDFEFLEDLFNLLAFITKKMSLLSLEEQIGLGKSLKIMKDFVDKLHECEFKTQKGSDLKQAFIRFFETKQGIYERDNFYSVASLLDPKCSNYDFHSDKSFDAAVKNLHEVLCYKLDEKFNLALYKIRAPLRIELENFHKYRPYKTTNEVTKFQLNSPVLQNLAYEYLCGSAICFEPKQINYEIREQIIECLSQIRRDSLSKILLLNSLDADVFDKLIEHAKFW